MTAEEAIFRIEERAFDVIKGRVKDHDCTTIEELAQKMCKEIKFIADKYKEI